MINEQIVIPQWLEVHPEVRNAISSIMGLTRNGATEVAGGRVMCDGYNHEDLKGITLEKINANLGKEYTSLVEGFNALIEKLSTEAVDITPKTIKEAIVEKVEEVTEAIAAGADRLYNIPKAPKPVAQPKKVKK
jgi:hypothetical protein